ncbi:MAG: hypothetical protein KGY41_03460 [Desulfovermiculus sp.]|nr:hypothetical protein [Desulfovermiculus sp.]
MKRQFTREEVAQGDGREGRPVYIVFENTVYDLSQSPLWKEGRHMQMHLSGGDLTDQLAAAPHFAEVFTKKNVKEVGVLKADQQSKDLPDFLKTLFRLFPILRRHPHPISVHFPTAYLVAALLFLVLHGLFGSPSKLNFEIFSFTMLLLGVLSAVPTVGTGFLTLWVNYRFKKTQLVQWKIRFGLHPFGSWVAGHFAAGHRPGGNSFFGMDL